MVLSQASTQFPNEIPNVWDAESPAGPLSETRYEQLDTVANFGQSFSGHQGTRRSQPLYDWADRQADEDQASPHRSKMENGNKYTREHC